LCGRSSLLLAGDRRVCLYLVSLTEIILASLDRRHRSTALWLRTPCR